MVRTMPWQDVCPPICLSVHQYVAHFILEMMQDGAIVTVDGEYEMPLMFFVDCMLRPPYVLCTAYSILTKKVTLIANHFRTSIYVIVDIDMALQ